MPERDLTTWKAIAEVLETTPRTAQRWAKERGLPVHRLPGGGGRVRASASALEAWLRAATESAVVVRRDEQCSYRWPLTRFVTAELRITGAPLCVEHLHRLRQYLDLVQASLED